jgi:hypothetical protein
VPLTAQKPILRSISCVCAAFGPRSESRIACIYDKLFGEFVKSSLNLSVTPRPTSLYTVLMVQRVSPLILTYKDLIVQSGPTTSRGRSFKAGVRLGSNRMPLARPAGLTPCRKSQLSLAARTDPMEPHRAKGRGSGASNGFQRSVGRTFSTPRLIRPQQPPSRV